MANNKMNTSFNAIELPSKPSTAAGPQRNPGVCAALNTPSTEGPTIHTKWYESPQQAPNLIGKNVAEKMDASFRGHIIADTFTPAGEAYGKGANKMDSSFDAANLVHSLGRGSSQGSGPGSMTPPASNTNDGIGSGANTSGGGDMNPRKPY